MNLQQGFWRLGAIVILSLFSPSLFAQNCSNNQSPIANAGPDRSGNVGVAMTFSSQGSSDPDGVLNSYWFNFGDGAYTGWQPNSSVSHSFASAGSYSVRLWVRDNCNVFSAADTAVITITAGNNPCAGNTPPQAQLSVPSSGMVGQLLSFSASNSSDPGGSIASYAWNFGDGSSANGVSVSKSYASAGNFTITLTLTDNCGASAMANASISISASNPCAGNTAPVANAGPDKQGNPNVAIAFSGSASSDVNGNNTIQSYWFNFGDGSFTGWQSAASTSHAFANVGSYTVRLWVRDNCGAMSASDLAIVTIAAPNPCAGNQPPVAQASANPASASVNQSIAFSAAGSSDPNGSITSYAWNFGDGSSGSGLNASHAYASAGSFNVILTVTDNCGATATKTISVNITNPNQGLVANFEVQKLVHVDPQTGEETWEAMETNEQGQIEVELGLRFRLNGSFSTGAITSYHWRKNGFLIGTGPILIRQYTEANQNHEIKLIVYGSGGQSADLTKTIHVNAGVHYAGDAIQIPVPNTAYAMDGTVLTSTMIGDEIWVTTTAGRLGVMNIAEENLSQLQLITTHQNGIPVSVMNTYSLCSDGEYLFFGRSNYGVDIRFKNAANPALLRNIPQSVLGGEYAGSVACVNSDAGRALYVGGAAFGYLNVFNVANITSPTLQPVQQIQIPGGAKKLLFIEELDLLVVGGTNQITLLNASNPTQLTNFGSTQLLLEHPIYGWAYEDGRVVVLSTYNTLTKVNIVDATNPFIESHSPDLSCAFSFMGGVALENGRLFKAGGLDCWFAKIDMVVPLGTDPYPIQKFAAVDAGVQHFGLFLRTYSGGVKRIFCPINGVTIRSYIDG